jgi:hypothetical protein
MLFDCTQQHRCWEAALLVILLSSISVLGQTSPPPATNTSTQRTKIGSITGRVINESGQPLANVSVTVRAVGSSRSEEIVTTDNEGRFEVAGIEGVNYQVYAWFTAYAPVLRDDNAPASYRIGESVRLVMTKGGVITGTVTTQNGDPVVGVRVRARMTGNRNRLPFPYGEIPFERTTDDRGVYRIYGLPAGTYMVSAGGAGEMSSMYGDPYDNDVPTYAPSSNRDTAAEINVQAGEESNNVDIRYRGEPGRIVSGSVSRPTGGPSGFSVVLTSAADGGSEFNLNAFQSPRDKGFIFYGVDDGDYDVTARTTLPDGQWVLSAAKRIKVRGADVTGLELTVQPLGSISGQLVLEELKTKECGDKQPLMFTETQVSAWHKDDAAARSQPRFVWQLGAPVNADAQGNVLLKNLAPGEYYFVTRFLGKTWYVQSVSMTAPPPKKVIDATRVWTTVKNGDRISGLKIILAEGAGSLSGQLELAEGEALQEKLFVYLVPAEQERAADPLRFYGGPVQADGKFSLNNVAPGRYWILTKPASDPAQTKFRLPDETQTRARVRHDAEAAKTEIEFKPCQNVVDYRLKI